MRFAVGVWIACVLAGSCLWAAGVTHAVRKGETVYSIARNYKVSVGQLLEVNPSVRDAGKIRVGQMLVIPVVVKKGVSKLSPVRSVEKEEEEEKKADLFVSKVRTKLGWPKELRNWRYVIVHHSGTDSGNARIFGYYHRNLRHMENGLAYHFVIGNGTDSGDGQIEVGTRWMKQLQGGHVSDDEMNEVAIGICLVGDFSHRKPTKNQMLALMELIRYLESRCPRKLKLMGHREHNSYTECPGKYFPLKMLHRMFD